MKRLIAKIWLSLIGVCAALALIFVVCVLPFLVADGYIFDIVFGAP